jgi:hypothetical protein
MYFPEKSIIYYIGKETNMKNFTFNDIITAVNNPDFNLFHSPVTGSIHMMYKKVESIHSLNSLNEQSFKKWVKQSVNYTNKETI